MPQPSRKGKKAWRKNIDISKVENDLNEIRDEILVGGVVKERANEELFAVDVKGDEKIAARLRKHGKPLKMDEILAQRSSIPCPETKKRKRGMSYVEKQRLKKIAGRDLDLSPKVVHNRRAQPESFYDVWDAEITTGDEKIKKPATLAQEPVRLSANRKKIPSVRKPEAGVSYNPAMTDWEDLIEIEGSAERARELVRLAEDAERERLRQLAELPDTFDVARSGSETDTEGDSVPKRPPPGRKTKEQRRREEKRKEEEKARKTLQMGKKMRDDLVALKAIKRALARKVEKETERAALDEVDDEAPLRKRRFGKHTIIEANLEIQLADELAESLRKLRPEGNLLRDRYRSFQERGFVEPRVPVTAKKPKVVSSEKHSYKRIL